MGIVKFPFNYTCEVISFKYIVNFRDKSNFVLAIKYWSADILAIVHVKKIFLIDVTFFDRFRRLVQESFDVFI